MKTQQVLHILHLTDGNRGGSQRHIVDLCRDGDGLGCTALAVDPQV